MYILQRDANENGGRPAPQEWRHKEIPDGYVQLPDRFYSTYYSTEPAGFVTIETEGDTVTGMAVNQEALDAYLENLPEAVEPEPSDEEKLRADVDYLAVMTGVEL